MTNGRINLKKLNLLGYTPETQVFIVQNAGGNGSVATFHFLKKIGKFMDRTSDGWAIAAKRVADFKAFCATEGFEVVDAGWTA